MKKIILLFVVVFELGEAQETLPIYQQYLFDGEFLFNPAHLGKTDDFVLNANYQKQFSKLEESPNIQSLGAHANNSLSESEGSSFFSWFWIGSILFCAIGR